MKATNYLGLIVGGILCLYLFSACSDILWQATQLPGLRSVSDRMNDRALQRRLGGDPIQELNENTQQGDYRFLGLADFAAKRTWVPGIAAGHFETYQVVYLVTDRQATWTASAERYFSTYNKALEARRRGKKLDTYGMLVL